MLCVAAAITWAESEFAHTDAQKLRATIDTLDLVHTRATHAQEALQRFALSTDELELEQARSALVALREISGAHLQSAANPLTRSNWSTIEERCRERLSFVEELIAMEHDHRKAAARAAVLDDFYTNKMARLLQPIQQLQTDQYFALSDAHLASTARTQSTVELCIAAGLISAFSIYTASRRRKTHTPSRSITAETEEVSWQLHSVQHKLRHHETIFDTITDLVIIVTRSLDITRANPAALSTLKVNEGDLLAHPLHRFVESALADEPGEPLAAVRRALEDGTPLRDIPVSLTRHGHILCRATLSVLPLRDGEKITGGVVVVHQKNQAAAAA